MQECICDKLTIWIAEPGATAGNLQRPLSMMCGRSFISRLHARRAVFEAHEGPLSIKTVYRGREQYTLEGASLEVRPGAYLILNAGQRYASEIDAHEEATSLCIWFRPGLAGDVEASAIGTPEKLLDEPDTLAASRAFVERIYLRDALISPVIDKIYAATHSGEATGGWLEEQTHLLIERMLALHHAVRQEADSLPGVRLSTRMEIYRRLHRGRDYLDSNLSRSVSLAEVASVACMSPHHFLRLFKQAFSVTPHQYHVSRKIEAACQLLRSTDVPVTQICTDLGFESLGSFSWMFRRRLGMPPSAYRRLKRE